MNVEVGQWVVEKGLYGYELHQANRVTGATVFHKRPYGNREGRIRVAALVFAGAEDAARLLHARLQSSKAQFEDDKRKAGIRKQKRDADFIVAAKT